MIVTNDNQVVAFLSLSTIPFAQGTIFRICREGLTKNCIVGANHICIVCIGYFVIVPIYHVILAAVFINFRSESKKAFIFMIQAAGYFIIDTQYLCEDGFVNFIATTDSQRSTTTISTGNCSS